MSSMTSCFLECSNMANRWPTLFWKRETYRKTLFNLHWHWFFQKIRTTVCGEGHNVSHKVLITLITQTLSSFHCHSRVVGCWGYQDRFDIDSPYQDDGHHWYEMINIMTIDIIEEGFKQKPRQRSSRLFEGQILLNSLPRKLFCLDQYGRKGWIQLYLSNQPRQKS